MLTEQTALSAFTIIDITGQKETLSLADIDYRLDYSGKLQELLNAQEPFMWPGQLAYSWEYELTPEVICEEEVLVKAIRSLSLLQSEQPQTGDVQIIKTSTGYQLYDTTENILNPVKTVKKIAEAVQRGQTGIILSEAGCYEVTDKTEDMLATLKLWDKIDKLQSWYMEYDMDGEIVPVNKAVTAKWLAVDENGSFLLTKDKEPMIDPAQVEVYVEQLAEKYDTYNTSREFHTTGGLDIVVEGGTFGRQIDRTAETAYLIQAFGSQESERVRIPAYRKETLFHDSDALNRTYIEINMTDQMLYYYVDGECILETPVVTGNQKRNMSTPAGVYYVYMKQKNRILRGPDYATPVTYWMPVKGSIGIHDANWRSKFGGEIYKTGGSHGCINTPTAAMKELFELAEVGTPVVMYYLPEEEEE